MRNFINLVEHNFSIVPRRLVLSNMIHVDKIVGNFENEYYELSGRIIAALKRKEISFDQINNQAILNSLSINLDINLETVKVMVYTDSFAKKIDDYRIGYAERIVLLILNVLFEIYLAYLLTLSLIR